MKTIGEAAAIFKQALSVLYDVREIDAIAMLVLTDVLNTSRARIKAFPEEVLTDAQSASVIACLAELQTGKPVQYVLGQTEFYGLPFKVNPAVLIPRPETEELVEWAIGSVGGGQLAILDIGTGSGCIAISLKKNLPGARVSALDISADALAIAKQNAALNDVEIEFIEADVLKLSINPSLNIDHSALTTRYSPLTTHYSPLTTNYFLIISNPPYVTPEDKTQMHQNVNNFEPHTALFVPQDDPLLFYKAIANFAKQRLLDNGLLFFEINENYGNETVEMLETAGFKHIELKQDLSGRDRMIKAVWNK